MHALSPPCRTTGILHQSQHGFDLAYIKTR